MRASITIATRGSKLALWQAERVKSLLRAAEPALSVELLPVKTRGDKILDVPLSKVGGKGLFVKEIEEALLDGRADLAVHSMKDVPAELAPDLTMAAISERGNPFDALISAGDLGLADLPEGAVVGTSSLRRGCQILAARPDVEIKTLRGNVGTRLRKLDEGQYQAVVLAAAGLERLGFADRISERLEPPAFLPAVGQGALGVEIRAGDDELAELLSRAVHSETDAVEIAAERGFLARLGGTCQTPLAAFARLADGEVEIEGLIGRPDGSELIRGSARGPAAEASDVGRGLAEELLGRGGQAIMAALSAD